MVPPKEDCEQSMENPNEDCDDRHFFLKEGNYWRIMNFFTNDKNSLPTSPQSGLLDKASVEDSTAEECFTQEPHLIMHAKSTIFLAVIPLNSQYVPRLHNGTESNSIELDSGMMSLHYLRVDFVLILFPNHTADNKA